MGLVVSTWSTSGTASPEDAPEAVPRLCGNDPKTSRDFRGAGVGQLVDVPSRICGALRADHARSQLSAGRSPVYEVDRKHAR